MKTKTRLMKNKTRLMKGIRLYLIGAGIVCGVMAAYAPTTAGVIFLTAAAVIGITSGLLGLIY